MVAGGFGFELSLNLYKNLVDFHMYYSGNTLLKKSLRNSVKKKVAEHGQSMVNQSCVGRLNFTLFFNSHRYVSAI